VCRKQRSTRQTCNDGKGPKTKSTRGAKPCAFEIGGLNGSAFGPIEDYLAITDDAVLCGQEHRLSRAKIAEVSKRLAKKGWKSIWTAALPTATSTSAGTVICAREHLEFWNEEDPGTAFGDVVPGRCCAAHCKAGGLG
jgi:exonuclease III